MNRGYKSNGVYMIEPKAGESVGTYCNFDEDKNGGGWTLLINVVSNAGWTVESVKKRSSDDPLNSDYSIFGMIDEMMDPYNVEVIIMYFIRFCHQFQVRLCE